MSRKITYPFRSHLVKQLQRGRRPEPRGAVSIPKHVRSTVYDSRLPMGSQRIPLFRFCVFFTEHTEWKYSCFVNRDNIWRKPRNMRPEFHFKLLDHLFLLGLLILWPQQVAGAAGRLQLCFIRDGPPVCILGVSDQSVRGSPTMLFGRSGCTTKLTSAICSINVSASCSSLYSSSS